MGMNTVSYLDAIDILGTINEKLNNLYSSCNELEEKVGFRESIILQLKVDFKEFKELISMYVKIFTQDDNNLYIQDYLLPALCISQNFLVNIGVNRININNIKNIRQVLIKVSFYIKRYYNYLTNF